MILLYSTFSALAMMYLYYIGHKSMHAGAIVIAMGTVAWGPYLQTADKYPHTLLLSVLNRKIIPRYQEWIAESAMYLNAIFVMLIISLSVCILTFFELTGGEYPFLYYILVGAMVVGNVLATISSMTVSARLQKMAAAHNLMRNVVGLLNTRDEEEYSEEEESDVAEFFSIVTSNETWELLTTDNEDDNNTPS